MITILVHATSCFQDVLATNHSQERTDHFLSPIGSHYKVVIQEEQPTAHLTSNSDVAQKEQGSILFESLEIKRSHA